MEWWRGTSPTIYRRTLKGSSRSIVRVCQKCRIFHYTLVSLYRLKSELVNPIRARFIDALLRERDGAEFHFTSIYFNWVVKITAIHIRP